MPMSEPSTEELNLNIARENLMRMKLQVTLDKYSNGDCSLNELIDAASHVLRTTAHGRIIRTP